MLSEANLIEYLTEAYQGKAASTVDGAHAGIKFWYDKSHRRGEFGATIDQVWSINVSADGESVVCRGNPATAPSVCEWLIRDLIKQVMATIRAMKQHDRQSGRKIRRARPMTYQEMRDLHRYLFSHNTPYAQKVRDYIWAIAMLAWSLFLRIDEALTLPIGEIVVSHCSTGSDGTLTFSPLLDIDNIPVARVCLQKFTD
jgi:hypothetical protein